jgi:uncharacterized protein (TIGR03086 family)
VAFVGLGVAASFYHAAMDHHEALDRAGDGFLQRLRGVSAEQWDASTPCGDWSVRDLVQHILGGSQMAVTLAQGGTRQEATAALEAPLDESDPVGAIESIFTAEAQAFARPEVLERILPHPAADLPGADVLGFRVTDRAVHTWDLARATGQDEALDPEVLEVVWGGVEPMLPMLGSIGVFGDGPSGDLADDAGLQAKVLDAVGRRP